MKNERIEFLREENLNLRVDTPWQFNRYFFEVFAREDGTLHHRYAKAFRYAMNHITPRISEGELIVGKHQWVLTPEERACWEGGIKADSERIRGEAFVGQDSHMAVDYVLLLNEGTHGVAKRIRGYMAACNDPEKLDFYNACLETLAAVEDLSLRYAALAEEKAATHTANDPRRAELFEIARVCRKVPMEPAEHFYEALQSVHFLAHCLTFFPYRLAEQYQLGHPDRYLWKYYKQDLDAGILTREGAQELADLLGIQINNRVPRGLSSGYMVGGRDADGNVVSNDLTEIFMQVIPDVRLVYPSVGLCMTKDTPKKDLRLACEILAGGASHPAIFNDDVITEGLRRYGVPEREAHEYIHSTCVEITPVASSNVWVASPYTNMPEILLSLLDREYATCDALLAAFFDHLDALIREHFEEQERYREIRRKYTVQPLLSCFVNDCLAEGTDIEAGGARYNWTMPSFVGIANVADSLGVLKKLVFTEHKYTIAEIKKILDRNFAGYEDVRLEFLNSCEKYGNDIDSADEPVGVIVDHIVAECKKYKPVYRNARLVPSAFCWVMHGRMGENTGATPDGRPAGFPLGDGSGPCQGRDRNGPAASILSSTKWDPTELIGGVAVNMKFEKASFGEQSVANLQALIETYVARGGFEIQINVVDNQLLRRAMKEPENYRDLIVRIGGYSDYFVDLSVGMQEEVILRSEHRL